MSRGTSFIAIFSRLLFASAAELMSSSPNSQHIHADLPVIHAAHADGTLKPGRHIVYPKGTSMTNLYLTVLDRVGVHPESIGDSTGKVEHLSGV